MTANSITALNHLRTTDNLQWYVVPIIIVIAYIYLNEREKGNHSAVRLGIALWGFEIIWEIINGLVLHFSRYAPMWSTPTGSSYLIYVGLPVEVSLFFAVGGLVLIKALPADRDLKLAGISNRFFIPAAGAVSATIAEFMLYRAGFLGWDWWWWGSQCLVVIFINYFIPSYALVWMHDNLTHRQKRKLAMFLPGLAFLCHIVFASWLKWV